LAISKETKEARVAQYQQLVGDSQAFILTEYKNLTMKQLNDLRGQLRGVGASYHVTKNTLLQLALQQMGRPTLDAMLEGPTAVGYLGGDFAAGIKVLLQFAEDSKAIEVKGGLMGDRALSADDVVVLSKLPGREELLAQLLSRLQGPMYGLVSVLNGPIRGLLYALKARQEQLAETAA